MITQLPAPPENSFYHYAFLVFGWIVTTGAFGWVAYRWGLRSQVFAEKLKAKNAARAIADAILSEIPKQKTLVTLFGKTREDLKISVFRFSSQLSLGKRLRIEKALDEYQELKITEKFYFPDKEPDKRKVEIERKAMLDALNHLRTVISKS